MTSSTQPDPVAIDLVAINRELAALLHTDAADLPLGAPDPFGDDLVVCGILGGKDVGKSTLINALAQTNVSDASQEIGEGTARPMVYVHEDVRDGVEPVGSHECCEQNERACRKDKGRGRERVTVPSWHHGLRLVGAAEGIRALGD